MARKRDESGVKIVAKNRRARHEYHILETWEAGLVLLGTEVKALRAGRVNIGDAYAEIRDGEAVLRGLVRTQRELEILDEQVRENFDYAIRLRFRVDVEPDSG